MSGAGVSLAQSPVLFDAWAHTYTAPGGRRLSGVTELMRRHGLSPDYSGVPEATLRRAAERGTAVHGIIQDCVNGLFDDGAATARERAVADTWEAFRIGAGLEPLASEYLVSDCELVASKVDLVLSDLRLCDVKTTSTLHTSSLEWQLSIYAWLFERQNPGLRVPSLHAIHYDTRRGAFTLHGVRRLPDAEVSRLLACERAGARYTPPPAPTDGGAAAEGIRAFAEGAGLPAALSRLAEAKAVVDGLQARLDEAYAELYARMTEAGVDRVECPSFTLTRRPPTTRTTLDAKALRAEAPDVAARFTRTCEVRGGVTLRMRKDNDNDNDIQQTVK